MIPHSQSGAIVADVADRRRESRVAQVNGRALARTSPPPGGPNRATRLRSERASWR
jgi:hypothetical protein